MNDIEKEIVRLAMIIALETPTEQSKWCRHAYVRWTLIHKLRDALNQTPLRYDACRRWLQTTADLNRIVADHKTRETTR